MGIGFFLILLAIVIFILGFRGTYAIIPPFDKLKNINPTGL